MISFRNWLFENTDEQFSHPHDAIEDAIAESVYRIAFNAIRQWFHDDKKSDLMQVMEDKCQGFGKKTNFGSEAFPEWGIKIKLPKKIKGLEMPFVDAQVRIKLAPKDEMAYMGQNLITVHINEKLLKSANSFSDPAVQQVLAKLQYQLHHEATHLSSAKNIEDNKEHNSPYLQKKESDPRYNDYKVKYFTGDDELRSHAKQFAVIYDKYFPKDEFSVEKILKLKPIMPNKIERFFQGFDEKGHSEIWRMNTDKYQEEFKTAKEKLIPLIQNYMKVIRKRNF